VVVTKQGVFGTHSGDMGTDDPDGPLKAEAIPPTKAQLFANLPASALTKHEAALYRRPQDYFRARDVVLELWMANPKDFLTFTSCLKEAERRKIPETAVLNAYMFLTRHAYVNVGFPSMDKVEIGLDKVVSTTYASLLESNLAVRTSSRTSIVAFEVVLQQHFRLCKAIHALAASSMFCSHTEASTHSSHS
jgi:hypothetical protein